MDPIALRTARFERDYEDGNTGVYTLTLSAQDHAFLIQAREQLLDAQGRTAIDQCDDHSFPDRQEADETFDVWVEGAGQRGWKPAE